MASEFHQKTTTIQTQSFIVLSGYVDTRAGILGEIH